MMVSCGLIVHDSERTTKPVSATNHLKRGPNLVPVVGAGAARRMSESGW